MKLNDPKYKKNIYEVPDGYFDELSARIMKQTETTSGVSSVTLWWQKPAFKVAFASAMVLLIAFSAGWWFKPNPSETSIDSYAEASLENASEAEIQSYLLASDISYYDLVEYAQEENLGINGEESSSLEEQLLELDIEYTDFENIL